MSNERYQRTECNERIKCYGRIERSEPKERFERNQLNKCIGRNEWNTLTSETSVTSILSVQSEAYVCVERNENIECNELIDLN